MNKLITIRIPPPDSDSSDPSTWQSVSIEVPVTSLFRPDDYCLNGIVLSELDCIKAYYMGFAAATAGKPPAFPAKLTHVIGESKPNQTRRNNMNNANTNHADDSRYAESEWAHTTRRSYGEFVHDLRQNEVFVFGSNLDGIHAGGAAGYATFGPHRPGGRQLNPTAEYFTKSKGYRGRWTVKGVAEGLQRGNHGMSYALPTVDLSKDVRPSLSTDTVRRAIRRFYECAVRNPDLTFLVAGSYDVPGKPLSGYSHDEFCAMYRECGPVPLNVVFSITYTVRIFQSWAIAPAEGLVHTVKSKVTNGAVSFFSESPEHAEWLCRLLNGEVDSNPPSGLPGAGMD